MQTNYQVNLYFIDQSGPFVWR